jgi:hypothetical protein
MRLLTKDVKIVEYTRDSDSSLENSARLKSHFELLELVLVFCDLAINVGNETIFEDSLPW